MKDKVGATDQISILLNGKPVGEVNNVGSYICPKCGVDRAKERCPLSNNVPRMFNECPIVAKAQ